MATPLTPDLVAEVRRLFKTAPLVAKWPDFESIYLSRLEMRVTPINTPIYRPGDPPVHLFLVGEGTVRETVRLEDRAWFQRELTPGQIFGQQALFTGRYQSTATATTPVTLYQMAAADLRVAMERNLDLYEELLHEKRAGRLRRIPLFRDLSDDEMHWLAQVIEEVDLAAGEEAPLDTKPGIWIVDWGQLDVTGAASFGRRGWRITSGNFVVAQGGGLRFGGNCAADSAKACFKSHLFYLPAAHADRLVAACTDVGGLVAHPLDIAHLLAGPDTFSELSERQRLHLAQYCAWEFVPAGQNITTQGSVGHSYVIIRDGAALVSALDDRGRVRPRNYLGRGDSYGETSLLEGKQRDATVRAVTAPGPVAPGAPAGLRGCEHIILDRRDLQVAFADEPGLWGRDVPLVHRSIKVKEEQHAFDWMREGEVLRRRDRPHWLWLINPELVVFAIFALLGLLFVLAPADLRAAVGIFVLIISSLILLPIGAWLAYNYFDDYYALTNRRVTRRDHQLLVYEARVEAPVEMVQDVTVDVGFWGRVFDYGNLTIRTAAKIGAVKFDNVPGAEEFKEIILRERAEALAAARGQQKERLRRGLISELKFALPIPERARSLGDDAKPKTEQRWQERLYAWLRRKPAGVRRLPTSRRGTPGWLIRLTSGLPERWRKILVGKPPASPQTTSAGQFTWRKHWLNLLQRAGMPFLMLAVVLAAGLWLLAADPTIAGLPPPQLFLTWAFLFAFSLGWLAWNVADYSNDIYVVTDDKIIDIEAKPLGISAKRREGNLDRVQSVDSKQVGIWATIFNYGNVIIRTAAADEGYDFVMVPNPKLVQSIVFQKLDALRGKQEDRKAQERQQELIEGLEVYNQLRDGNWGRERRPG